MSNPIKIAPSLLSADFSCLKDEINQLTKSKADLLHLDVMDGHFVPNLTFGAPVIQKLRAHTSLPFDAHLMISNPLNFIKDFVEAGCDFITVHIEIDHVRETIDAIKSCGKKVGLSLRPDTSIDLLLPYLNKIDLILVMTVEPGFGGQSFQSAQMEKVKWLHQQRQENNLSFQISVDGGITPETASISQDTGADILVAGTSIFKDGPACYAQNIHALRGASSSK